MGEAARQFEPRPRSGGERGEGAALRRTQPPPLALHIAPRFESLVASAPRRKDAARRSPLMVSLVVHSLLAAALILIPLFSDEIPPAADGALRAFFAMPVVAAPPPPPPPPPPAAGARPRMAPATARPPESASFVAPIEVPDAIVPEETLSLGVEGGVPGGVEGGVPGGVVGGIVGGIPTAEPPPPARVVRVGGQVKAPRLLNTVMPEYPQLATQARLSAMIIIELRVGADGHVKTADVLRGHPLFDEPALVAVRQWRYAPLLLNGVPTEFIVNVTVMFRLQTAPAQGAS